jgi:hypothetical protein
MNKIGRKQACMAALMALTLIAHAGMTRAAEPTSNDAFKISDALTTEGLRQKFDQPGVAVLNWKTTFEKDRSGYWIMRADSKDGPFARANVRLIPGLEDSNTTRTYRFYDCQVKVGRVYYYKIDSVSTNGVFQTVFPITRAVIRRTRSGGNPPRDHNLEARIKALQDSRPESALSDLGNDAPASKAAKRD